MVFHYPLLLGSLISSKLHLVHSFLSPSPNSCLLLWATDPLHQLLAGHLSGQLSMEPQTQHISNRISSFPLQTSLLPFGFPLCSHSHIISHDISEHLLQVCYCALLGDMYKSDTGTELGFLMLFLRLHNLSEHMFPHAPPPLSLLCSSRLISSSYFIL